MFDQFDLPGMEDPGRLFVPAAIAGGRKADGYMLFFAICFEAEQGLVLGHRAFALCSQYGSGMAKPMQPERLHITLRALVGFADVLPMTIIEAARSAAAAVRMRRFIATFDELASFRSNDACILRCRSHDDQNISALSKQLGILLMRRGLRSRVSAPHMTAYYDVRREDAVHAIEPITCEVTGFSLLVSHRGATVHEPQGTWPLD
jgi:2'-5' RNA ligase